MADTEQVSISAGAQRQMHALQTAQPEAGPWLGVLAAVLEECANPAWDAVTQATRLRPERPPDAPLLAGAEIPVASALAERWLRQMLHLAGNAGPEAGSLQAAARAADLDPLALLETGINADADRLDAIGATLGAAPDPLAVAVGLASVPFLQAVRRRYGAASAPHWHEGFCPVCGDWPLLAEQRGLERVRRLRCGRCGSDWAQPGVRCPYCGVTGSAVRTALIPEQDGEARKVETCTSCRGYLKNIATLRAWAGDEIPLADLATVDLDLVAMAREFARPAPRVLEPGVRVMGDG